MKNRKTKFFIAIFILFWSIFFTPALAANQQSCSKTMPTILGDVCEDEPVKGFLANLIDFLGKYIIWPLAVLMLMIGGITYASASGNPERIKLAKDIISTTIISVVAYILIWYFFNIVLGKKSLADFLLNLLIFIF